MEVTADSKSTDIKELSVDSKNSYSSVNTEESNAVDNLSNASVENFEGGIESFYESRQGLNVIQDKETILQPEYGMSSNEMKNVFHSISKYVLEHDHESSSVELQPFLPQKELSKEII